MTLSPSHLHPLPYHSHPITVTPSPSQLLSENDISPDDCLVAFRQFDTDGNGLIDANEFTFFVSNVLGLRLRKPELNDLWRMIDVNGSGAVSALPAAVDPHHRPHHRPRPHRSTSRSSPRTSSRRTR